MSEHLTPDALDAYVVGELQGEAAQRLEDHAAACDACAQALARAAALDQSMTGAARALERSTPRRSFPKRLALAGGLAAAAALLAVLTRHPTPAQRRSPPPVVALLDEPMDPSRAPLLDGPMDESRTHLTLQSPGAMP